MIITTLILILTTLDIYTDKIAMVIATTFSMIVKEMYVNSSIDIDYNC